MISTKEAAVILGGISERRVRTLCREGRIKGAERIGGIWVLPDKPVIDAASRIRPGKIKVRERRRKNG